MKKNLLMLGLIAACISTMSTAAFACPDGDFCPPPPPGCHGPACHKPHCCPPPRVMIDERLKLTDAQKEQAKALRLKTREEMRPILQAIHTKCEQKEAIKRNQNMKAEAQCAQIEKLNNEIYALKKQAEDLRLQNKKDFEAILTPEQKEELKKIKAEARKHKFEKCKQCQKGQQPCKPMK